jgi:hypothetical protein
MIHFNVMLTESGASYITWVGKDGKPRTATDQNPALYAKVKSALIEGNDPSDLFDLATKPAVVADKRITYGPNGYSFVGEAIPEEMSAIIQRYQDEGKDTLNLVKFMERLANNPSLRSRKMLFTWTQSRNMVIDDEGYIIGYKGVRSDMLSSHSGTAAVDGVEMTGHIPNAVGTVITMPREAVTDDPHNGCSTGLHVGNFRYAKHFAAITLVVRVDPADVVSVPKDSSHEKMRVCRYEVVGLHESEQDDVAQTYEPESTVDPDEIDADFDAFMEYVPESFLSALRSRVAARFGRKGKDEQEAEV